MKDEFKELCGYSLLMFCATPIIAYFGGDAGLAKDMLPNIGLTIIAVMFLMFILVPLVDTLILKIKER